MSDDPSILGKRARTEQEELRIGKQVDMTVVNDEEDDDEDLGPMPAPSGEEAISKKKRKGKARIVFFHLRAL